MAQSPGAAAGQALCIPVGDGTQHAVGAHWPVRDAVNACCLRHRPGPVGDQYIDRGRAPGLPGVYLSPQRLGTLLVVVGIVLIGGGGGWSGSFVLHGGLWLAAADPPRCPLCWQGAPVTVPRDADHTRPVITT